MLNVVKSIRKREAIEGRSVSYCLDTRSHPSHMVMYCCACGDPPSLALPPHRRNSRTSRVLWEKLRATQSFPGQPGSI